MADQAWRRSVAAVRRLVQHQPLALKESAWPLLADVLRSDRPEARAVGGSGSGPRDVAVIPITGFIMQHRSLWSEIGLATSTEALQAQIRAAVADASVRAIVLNIESPGGFAYGLQEAAATIRSLRERKPIVAVANSYAASAAYWLASAASELVVTPSGDVGSIGVFAVHEDWSKAYEKAGVLPTVIRAGKYKAEFSDTAPLGDEARAELQRAVEETYSQFVADVALGRRVSGAVVETRFGAGRMVSSRRAVAAGMADRVATLEQVIAGAVAGGRGGGPGFAARADLDLRRRRLALVTGDPALARPGRRLTDAERVARHERRTVTAR